MLYKPFGVLSQFRSEGSRAGLSTLGLSLPKDVWPVGRLDADSEGILLLTNDMRMRAQMMEPEFGHQRVYWVQVEGEPTFDQILELAKPMTIKVKKQAWVTKPAEAHVLNDLPQLPERVPPIRFRKSVPTAWLSLTLTEGKNRQVRRMTAAVGLPTLRLVRVGVGRLRLEDLDILPGQCRPLSSDELAMAMMR